jgi:hypothetical protein
MEVALYIIRETIDYLVTNDELSTLGFTQRQRDRIPYGISAALYTLTDDIDWSDRTAYEVIWPMVEISVESLIQTDDISSRHIGNFMYNLIKNTCLRWC